MAGFEDGGGLGSANHYGPRHREGNLGTAILQDGNTKEIVFEFDGLDPPTAADLKSLKIPANACFVGQSIQVSEAGTLGGDRTGLTATVTCGDATLTAMPLTSAELAKLGWTEVVTVGSDQVVGATASGVGIAIAGTGGSTGTIATGRLKVVLQYVDAPATNNDDEA